MSSTSVIVTKKHFAIVPLPEGMTLAQCLDETEQALRTILTNKLEESKEILDKWKYGSMYHALGIAAIQFVEALLSFEHSLILEAMKIVNESLAVCDYYRKKHGFYSSLTNIFSKISYSNYTELELHAELCYAECSLLKGVLIIFESHSFYNVLRAGFKLRNCFGNYKICQEILTHTNWDNIDSKQHFESGVLMGLGTFNLVISLLPPKAIKLVEAVGFSGDRKTGLDYLQKCCELNGLRQSFGKLIYLAFNLIIVSALLDNEGDLSKCESIIETELNVNKGSAFYACLQARLYLVQGKIDESILLYNSTSKIQGLWPQMNHLCFWEMFLAYCFKMDWKSALPHISCLLNENIWSKIIYSYLKASTLIMVDPIGNKEEISTLMKDITVIAQKMSGKMISMEKLVVKKSDRYFKQEENLSMPMIEILYLFNYFKIFRRNKSLADNILKEIERYQEDPLYTSAECVFCGDNKALFLLLKGSALSNTESYDEASAQLQSVLDLKGKIKQDTYLIPYALVELAILNMKLENPVKAKELLNEVKRSYYGYDLEYRLEFMVHEMLAKLSAST